MVSEVCICEKALLAQNDTQSVIIAVGPFISGSKSSVNPDL